MELTRRSAIDADKAFVRLAMRQAYREVVIRQFGEWDDELHEQRFEHKWKRGEFEIVERSGDPVGAILSSDEKEHVRLRDLFLLPDDQGEGIGSRLVTQELSRARRLGKPLRLRVLKQNRAPAFYRRLGFTECGETETQLWMEAY